MARDHDPADRPNRDRDPDRDADATGARIGGILLAAGQSRRFGSENKLLAPLEGEPLVTHAARTLLAADLESLVVIVGHEADRVRAALSDLDVAIRHNPDYAAGQSRSVRIGAAEAARRDWDAALFALGDMPCVAVDTLDRLLDAFATAPESILVPSYEGRRGNPVLFDATHFDALASVSGDRGGRDLLETREDVARVAVDDPGVLCDIDEEADLQSLE